MKHYYKAEDNPRISPLIHSLDTKHIGIVGMGGGGEIALHLMRSGVTHMDLFDFDTLEAGNLVRHICGSSFIGKNKALAVKELLTDYNPICKNHIRAHQENILEDLDDFKKKIASMDLLICATDTDASRFAIASTAQQLEIPSITVSMFGNGVGGEIFLSRPQKACYGCLTQYQNRGELLEIYEKTQKKIDCSLSRDARKMPGLGIDQSFLTSLTARKSLDVLLEQTQHGLPIFGDPQANWIIFSLTGVPGATEQHGTTLFLEVPKSSSCSLC